MTLAKSINAVFLCLDGKRGLIIIVCYPVREALCSPCNFVRAPTGDHPVKNNANACTIYDDAPNND